jgi:hypothetical protein
VDASEDKNAEAQAQLRLGGCSYRRGYSKPFSTGAVVVAEDAIVIQDVVKSKGAYVERTFVQCWRRKG